VALKRSEAGGAAGGEKGETFLRLDTLLATNRLVYHSHSEFFCVGKLTKELQLQEHN
jgi:hypothetical protein